MKRPDAGNPNRAIDLFGPGLDGFQDGPPDATQLDAAIFNNVVESLCRMVEYTGIALDGLDFDQLIETLNQWPFDAANVPNGGTFTLKDSSTLVVEADGGNGGSEIEVQSGARVNLLAGAIQQVQAASLLEVLNGGSLRTIIGATVEFLGSAQIGSSAGDQLTVLAQTALEENVTIGASKTLTMTGPNSVVDVSTGDDTGQVLTGIVDFYSQTAAPPTTNGAMAWGGNNNLTIGGSGGLARFVAIPVEEYLPGPVGTVNAIEDTGLEISLLLAIDDVVYVTFEMESRNTGGANDINVEITVDGGVIGGTEPYQPVIANRVVGVRRVVKYKAVAAAVHVFKGRHGASAGTTTSLNLKLTVRQANEFA